MKGSVDKRSDFGVGSAIGGRGVRSRGRRVRSRVMDWLRSSMVDRLSRVCRLSNTIAAVMRSGCDMDRSSSDMMNQRGSMVDRGMVHSMSIALLPGIQIDLRNGDSITRHQRIAEIRRVNFTQFHCPFDAYI